MRRPSTSTMWRSGAFRWRRRACWPGCKISIRRVTEISYEVKTSEAREIVWSLEWKKAKGPSRKAVVRYPESALRKGAGW